MCCVASLGRFGTLFEFYDSANKDPPTQLLRKTTGVVSKSASKDNRAGGIRDYHWTAANAFYLLHSPGAALP